MTRTTEAEVRAALRRFVVITGDKPGAQGITDQSPLFGGGWLRSVHVMDLILLVEELTGRPVDVTALQPRSFHDIDAIVRNFCREG